MSSGAASFGRIRWADMQGEQRYSPNAAYSQSKLADLMFSQQLAAVAADRGWHLMSNGAHPGYTRTNLQTAGPSLGRDRVSLVSRIMFTLMPSQVHRQEVPFMSRIQATASRQSGVSPDLARDRLGVPAVLFRAGRCGATDVTAGSSHRVWHHRPDQHSGRVSGRRGHPGRLRRRVRHDGTSHLQRRGKMPSSPAAWAARPAWPLRWTPCSPIASSSPIHISRLKECMTRTGFRIRQRLKSETV
jgi:hypothetical protein